MISTSCSPHAVCCLISLVCALVLSVPVCAEEVTVELTSGRTFTARLDSRTDEETMWLRFDSAGSEMLRPVRWVRLARAEVAGRELTSEQFRQLAPQLVTSAPAPSPRSLPGHQPSRPAPINEVPIISTLNVASSQAVPRSKASSLQVDAHLANWDGDVEADGLIVYLFPVDQFGLFVPVRGWVEVTLLGQRTIAFQDAPSKGGRQFGQLGRWRKNLTTIHHPSGAYLLRLPFQAEHPQFDTGLSSHAVVNVRMVVPGDGTLERSLDGVRVRPFSPLRDTWQRQTGRRFFPTELTGRGKRTD